MEVAEEEKNCQSCVMFLLDGGIFSVQAEQTFRPPVQSVRSLYCYQLLSLRHIHSPFGSTAVFRVDYGYDFTSVSAK